MKKIILALSLVAVAGMQIETAQARDREWLVTGKIVNGVAFVPIGARVVEALPAFCPPGRCVVAAPIVCGPQVFCAPLVVVCEPRVVCAPPVYTRAVPVVGIATGYGYRPHFFGSFYESHPHRW